MVHLKQPDIGSDIGLAPNMRQTIIWAKDDLVY